MCRLKQHGDGRALADLAFQLDAGVVNPGNVLDDGQPQAGAAGGFAPALIHPVKALKHTGLRFFRDADAVVFHGEGAVAVPGAGGNDLDFAAGAVVADGVVAQVLACLLYTSYQRAGLPVLPDPYPHRYP